MQYRNGSGKYIDKDVPEIIPQKNEMTIRNKLLNADEEALQGDMLKKMINDPKMRQYLMRSDDKYVKFNLKISLKLRFFLLQLLKLLRKESIREYKLGGQPIDLQLLNTIERNVEERKRREKEEFEKLKRKNKYTEYHKLLEDFENDEDAYDEEDHARVFAGWRKNKNKWNKFRKIFLRKRVKDKDLKKKARRWNQWNKLKEKFGKRMRNNKFSSNNNKNNNKKRSLIKRMGKFMGKKIVRKFG